MIERGGTLNKLCLLLGAWLKGALAWSVIVSSLASACVQQSDPVLACPPGARLSTAGDTTCLPCSSGEYCAGGTAQPSTCIGNLEDHDGDPATPCSVVAGTCPVGTRQVTAPQGLACETCETGTSCEGGLAQPVRCVDSGLIDHDEDPATPCQLEHGSCGAGTVETGTGASAACEPCVVGEYCEGGITDQVVCADTGLVDHDDDPSTACAVPPGSCPAGTEEDAVDGVPMCLACAAGTFCAGGPASNAPCSSDEWDDDHDPSTACVMKASCGLTERVTDAGDALTDRTCEPCPANRVAAEPNSDVCGTWSLDGATVVPTYRVEILGVVLAPFDDQGEEWDGTGYASNGDFDTLVSLGSTGSYPDTVAWVGGLQAGPTYALPEVYGNARVSVHGFPEAATSLNAETASQSTFRPQWSSKGFEHVPIHSSTRILVSLYDDDVGTDDALSYFILDADALQAAFDFGAPVAMRIASNYRALWLEMNVTAEDTDGNQLAPTPLGGASVPAVEAYVAPSDETHALWVHGLDMDGGANVVLSWGNPVYWANTGGTSGPNPFAVNYHARAYLSVSNVVLEYAMDRFCVAPEACVLACHSAGCAQSGFALAARGSFGERWNVLGVVGGGAASGGSEAADTFAATGLGGFLSIDLEVARMRALYDHDALGAPVDYCAGADGFSLTSAALLLPGQDDGAVAYHSSGGTRDALDYGNPADVPGDYLLPLGRTGPEFYAGHQVIFRDDDEVYDHSRTKELVRSWVDALYP